MIAFLKFLRGYLRIKLWGFSPERFLNLCSNKGILLWDIEGKGDSYEMCISLSNFYRLRPIAKKTGTRVAILQRYGLPFLVPVLLKRKIFITGLVLTVAFWIGSSYFIWDIDLVGNYQITEDVFEGFLKEEHVSIGMAKNKLDIGMLEKQIRRKFSQVTWTSVKLTGTRLEISIKENDAPIVKEEEQDSSGRDLESEYDGVIVSMIVRNGVPMVKIGDTVEKGQILVNGKVPVYNEDGTVREYQYVDADADMMLEHTVNFRETLDSWHIKKEYTGRSKKNYYLHVGQKEWKLPENRPFFTYDTVVKESRPLLLEKLSIPVYGVVCTHREYQNVEYEYTLEEAKELLSKKLSAFLATLEEKGVQIIEKNVKIDTENNMWVICGEFLVREPVGKSVATKKADETEQPEKTEE
ncbi:MAG: sporulation protein YqfD [Roseburia sp.]|nr:sporulation protein YqfD [Roseburia sp.]